MTTIFLSLLTYAVILLAFSFIAFGIWRGYKRLLNSQDIVFRAYVEKHPRWYALMKFTLPVAIAVFCIQAINAGLKCVLIILKMATH